MLVGNRMITRPKRGTTEIIVEILTAASGTGVTKTSLVYKANLNFTRIEKYIELLMRKRMIEQYRVTGRNDVQSPLFYRTTSKGATALKLLKDSNSIIFGGREIEDETAMSIIS